MYMFICLICIVSVMKRLTKKEGDTICGLDFQPFCITVDKKYFCKVPCHRNFHCYLLLRIPIS